MLRKIVSLALSVGVLCSLVSCNLLTEKDENKIKNVILLIGDGMGPDQIRAGELYKEEKLFMQTIKQSVKVETVSYYGETTDSAAAATALATGTRTANGTVGRNIDGEDMETLVDIASGLGKRTGVITTEELYGATPMGFSGHSASRNNFDELLESAAISSKVNLFASYPLSPANRFMLDPFYENGYVAVDSPADISDSSAEKIIGQYVIMAELDSMIIDDDCVAFDGLVSEALEYLAKDEDGFFLMAEGAHIDHGGHNNDISYMLRELLAFDDMVKYVVNWAKDRNDTLVLVTADHETGGLYVADGIGYGELFDRKEDESFKNFLWTSTGHTSKDVWLYAYGATINFEDYSTYLNGLRLANTDVFKIAKAYLTGNLL